MYFHLTIKFICDNVTICTAVKIKRYIVFETSRINVDQRQK